MRTPGHAVLSLAVVARVGSVELAGPVVVGAVLPDLPIVVLYLVERFGRGTPDDRIWSERYRLPFWQTLIHGAHSIPLALALGAAALSLGHVAAAALFASMIGHSLCDLPLHAEDAHRHFLPLSNYRFESPLSYWDPRHHARVVALVEALVVLAAAALAWGPVGTPARAALVAVAAFYVVGYVRAFVYRGGRWDPWF